jgi:hypothetical protein
VDALVFGRKFDLPAYERVKMKDLVVAMVAVLIAADLALAKGKSETFDAPFEHVWKATLSVVAEEFTLESVSREDGVVSFRSGTQDASALVIEVSEGVTTVTVNAKAARAGLSIGLGIDGKKVKNKLLNGIKEKLRLRQLQVPPAPRPQPSEADQVPKAEEDKGSAEEGVPVEETAKP